MILEHTYIMMNFGLSDPNVTYDLRDTQYPLIDTIFYKIRTTDMQSNTTAYSDVQVFNASHADATVKMNASNGIGFDPVTGNFDRVKLAALMRDLATDTDKAKFISVEESNAQAIAAHMATP